MKTQTIKLPNIKSRSMLPQFSDADLETIGKKYGLTLEQLKNLHRCAYDTYQYIGADLHQVNDGKPMRREDLVEVVLDANHMETFNKRKLLPEVKAWCDSAAEKYGLNTMYSIVAIAFPFALYE